METNIYNIKKTIEDLHSDLNLMANKEWGAVDLNDKYSKNDPIVRYHREKFNNFVTKYGVEVPLPELSELTEEELINLEENKLVILAFNLLINLMASIKDAYYKELNQKI